MKRWQQSAQPVVLNLLDQEMMKTTKTNRTENSDFAI